MATYTYKFRGSGSRSSASGFETIDLRNRNRELVWTITKSVEPVRGGAIHRTTFTDCRSNQPQGQYEWRNGRLKHQAPNSEGIWLDASTIWGQANGGNMQIGPGQQGFNYTCYFNVPLPRRYDAREGTTMRFFEVRVNGAAPQEYIIQNCRTGVAVGTLRAGHGDRIATLELSDPNFETAYPEMFSRIIFYAHFIFMRDPAFGQLGSHITP
ncbi:hypothetical protein DFP72DRAFT_848651 [Ephemerocybe angulata]|uniref:Uncharacterized protein n=1 Tax=Ephemerocybe angulata TaxID=980116 RepID=A0A8H6HVP6_9AGAR|nr:hypothetical protein DFP72DRAFT_848651 [Tulosesus angulatus]